MKQNEFDHLNWGNFDESNYQFDVDQQWSRLEKTMVASRKKKDRKFFYFLSIAALFLCFTALGYYAIPHFLFNKNSQAKLVKQNNVVDIDADAIKSEIGDANKNINNTTIGTSNGANNKKQDHTNSIKGGQISKNNLIENTTTDLNTNDELNIVSNRINQLQNANNSTSPNAKINETAAPESIVNNPLVIDPINQSNSVAAMEILALRSIKPLLPNSHDVNIIIPNLVIQPIAKFKKPHPNYWIGAGFHYGYAMHDIKPLAIEQKALVDSRLLREKQYDGFQTEISLSRDITNSVFMQSGFSATKLYSKVYDNYQQDVEKILENQIIRIEKRENRTDTIYGTLVVKSRNSYTDKYYNKYTSINIPLTVGLKKKVSRHQELSVDGGVSVSILNRTEGSIPKSYTLPTSLSLSEVKYHAAGILDARLNMSYAYYLNSQTKFAAIIGLNADLTSRVNRSEGYTHQFNYLHIGTQISRRF